MTANQAPTRPLLLTSFGYLHLNEPPAADRVEDVRERFRDPAAARDVLDLDGTDPRVQDIVLNTPGAADLVENLVENALMPEGAPRSIVIGCAGGKHRACALIEILAVRLRERGRDVEIRHLHAHLPRVVSRKESPLEVTGDPAHG